MKVICINNQSYQNLTLYKLYDVYEMINKGNITNVNPSKIIFIHNDIGNIYPYPKEIFKKLDEWREQRINTILNS